MTKTARPFFRYKVKDEKGHIRSGRATGTLSAVRKLLQSRGYTIISIVEEQSAIGRFSSGKVSAKDRSIMYRELSTMLKAGVGITQAIDIVAETPNKRLRKVMTQIHHSLENGFALSVAMAGQPKTFPEVEVGVVRAGEATGNLVKVLDDLSSSTARSAEFVGKVRGAMIYPAFIMIVMVIVGAIILTKVIPPIKEIFISQATELPVSTKILLAITDFLINQWVLLIGIVTGLVLVVRLFTLTKPGKEVSSFIALHFPIFGPLTRQVYLARFNRTLSLLLSAGVPILEAVGIIADSTANTIFRRTLKLLMRSLEQGAAVTSTMQDNKYFPKLMTQLLFVGQQSGDLGGSASTLADYFEQEVDSKLRTFSALIEPFIIVILGGAVAFIVISVLQPIYSLTGSF
ncbi:MAG: type II secretion system F family protein [Patescibacteria group bacterium]|mgnify:FL=1